MTNVVHATPKCLKLMQNIRTRSQFCHCSAVAIFRTNVRGTSTKTGLVNGPLNSVENSDCPGLCIWHPHLNFGSFAFQCDIYNREGTKKRTCCPISMSSCFNTVLAEHGYSFCPQQTKKQIPSIPKPSFHSMSQRFSYTKYQSPTLTVENDNRLQRTNPPPGWPSS